MLPETMKRKEYMNMLKKKKNPAPVEEAPSEEEAPILTGY